MKTPLVLIAALFIFSASASAQTAGTSPICGPIQGKTAKDMQNVKTFCATAIAPGSVVRAHAMGSILWVKVNRPMAEALREDKLSTEQIVKNWMKGWRVLSGSASVTVFVEWGDVEIAKGDFSLLRGDVVTIR